MAAVAPTDMCRKSCGIIDFVGTSKDVDSYQVNVGKLEAGRSHVVLHLAGEPEIMLFDGTTIEDPYRRQNYLTYSIMQIFKNFYFSKDSAEFSLETWRFSNGAKMMEVEHYSFPDKYGKALQKVVQAYEDFSLVHITHCAQQYSDDETASIELDVPESDKIVVFQEHEADDEKSTSQDTLEKKEASIHT
jgi:hypothetical protein